MHDGCVTASAAADDGEPHHEAAAVRAFLHRVEGARLRSHLQVAFTSTGVPLLCAVLLLALGAPTAALWVGGIAGLIVVVLLSTVTVRERRALRRALLELRAKGQPIGDLLLAWDEVEARGAAASPMAQWLRSDLATVVAALPPHTEVKWLAPHFGRVRYSVPIAVVLLLLWWLRPDFDLPIYGLGGAPPPVHPDGSGESEEGRGGAGSSPEGNSPTPPVSDEPLAGDQPEQSPPLPQQGPEPEAESPAPFLDLPAHAEILVPEFTRDGPTRRAMAERALTGGGEEAGSNPPPDTRGGKDAGGSLMPPPDREEFQRAQERALQSRRVPARERTIVRAFWKLLQEDGK